MASIRRSIAQLPDAVHTVVIALSVAAVYFAAAAALELTGLTSRLPLAPAPWLGLGASLVNCLLIVGLFNAVGWVRPLVALVPLAAYPVEYGLHRPDLISIQSAELLAVLVLMPAAVIYYLYFDADARRWFSATQSSEV